MRLVNLVAAVSAALLAGCSASPTQRWVASSEALVTARDTTLTLHSANIIDDVTLVRLDKVEKVARGALDVARTQLPDGGDSFEEWMAVARGALRELALSYDGTVDIVASEEIHR